MFSPMKSTILHILSLFVTLSLFGNPIPFVPIVRNHTTKDYNGGSQNWSIGQDKEGRMFFGNNKGLLEYDGHYWNLYPIPTNGIIRSVYIAEDGRIYVGSFEEFGYFERDATNKLNYHSLKQGVADYTFHNDEIWNILLVDGKILFHSFASYFIYDGHTTTGYRLNKMPLNLFRIDSTLYSQQINNGLNIYKNNEFNNLLPREAVNDDIVKGLSHPDGILLFTKNNGCYLYNGKSVLPWCTSCDNELKHNTINKAIITRDSTYILGTISNGIYALNFHGQLLWKLNADNQLVNNTVLGLYNDRENNIWVALDNGIAYIHNNSHIFYYEPASKIGMVYDMLVEDNRAYIASNQGLYYLQGDTGELNLVPNMGEQAWTVGRWGNQIIAGHNKGTYQITGNKAVRISSISGAMCMKEGKVDNQEILIQGTYALPNIYKKGANDEWYLSNSVLGFSHMAKNIEFDHRGNIWVEHMRRGLYRFRLDADLTRATDVNFYKSLSDENPRQKCYLFNINGRVVFSDGDSFYTYDDIMDSIVPYSLMNEQLHGLKNIHSVDKHRKNLYWFLSDKEAYLVNCELTEFNVISKISFSIFRNPPIEERSKIIFDKATNCSYLCLNNSIAKITFDNITDVHVGNVGLLILTEFKVTRGYESQPEYYPLRDGQIVPANVNQMEFSIAYPVYNHPDVNVRYKLQGLSDSWTESKSRFRKIYTRLPAGKYTFIAEALDKNEVISRIEFPFEVAHAWYLSYTAITIYILLFFSLMTGLFYFVYVYTKRRKDKVIESQRIQHEARIREHETKIIELEKNQLEADLKFKSKELSGVVMTNIAHQEFLQALKHEIQQQKLSGQYNRRNLDKLLSMLNQNLVADEENWNMFQANFDRIHENFFRNLKEQYPDLTSGDLRLCGLLRLNLPTKEISKLMSISIRGVDAARYRLRKKLGLPPESSLTDFMINLK